MRMIFAGTPEFARVQLEALIQAGYTIDLVLTQPDKPAGRGKKLTPPPVKVLALEHNIPVLQPTTLKDPEWVERLKMLNPDLMIVSAYGMILPKAILEIPRLGCWNVHASLLPRWRGASPIQHALLSGDKETGITLMRMDVGLDTGPILLKQAIAIEKNETAQTLHDKLATLGAKLLLEGLKKAPLQEIPQPEGATYAPKITKEQAHLDWSMSAQTLERSIRAYQPWPVAFLFYRGERIKIWAAEAIEGIPSKPPGTILSVLPKGIEVSTGEGILRLTELQLPGKTRITIQDCINAKPDWFAVNESFE